MRVEVWVRASLVKRLDGDDQKAPYLFITAWDDDESPTIGEAAHRVYRVCSSGALDLTPTERAWQDQWRAARHGYGFGVGDVVVVDGSALQCHRLGFSHTEWPR